MLQAARASPGILPRSVRPPERDAAAFDIGAGGKTRRPRCFVGTGFQCIKLLWQKQPPIPVTKIFRCCKNDFRRKYIMIF